MVLGLDAWQLATTRDREEQAFMMLALKRAGELRGELQDAQAVRIANAVAQMLNGS